MELSFTRDGETQVEFDLIVEAQRHRKQMVRHPVTMGVNYIAEVAATFVVTSSAGSGDGSGSGDGGAQGEPPVEVSFRVVVSYDVDHVYVCTHAHVCVRARACVRVFCRVCRGVAGLPTGARTRCCAQVQPVPAHLGRDEQPPHPPHCRRGSRRHVRVRRS